MAEYYKWLNVDKREYISPWNFDLGSRCTESMTRGNGALCALQKLLDERWRGDHILFLGDECPLSGGEENPALRVLYGQSIRLGYPRTVADLIGEDYRNISCLFRGAEKVTRADIRLMLGEREDESIFELPNEYGVDWSDPFAGLFEQVGREFRYIVNYTKGLCYCLDETRIMYPNDAVTTELDPLPVLMGWGRELEPGPWLGDIVGVSEKIPEGVKLLREICGKQGS